MVDILKAISRYLISYRMFMYGSALYLCGEFIGCGYQLGAPHPNTRPNTRLNTHPNTQVDLQVDPQVDSQADSHSPLNHAQQMVKVLNKTPYPELNLSAVNAWRELSTAPHLSARCTTPMITIELNSNPITWRDPDSSRYTRTRALTVRVLCRDDVKVASARGLYMSALDGQFAERDEVIAVMTSLVRRATLRLKFD